MPRLEKLPGWITSNRDSVRREASPYRAMTPAERLDLGSRASRAALAVALTSSTGRDVLEYRDPLPASSRRALERLRAAYRASR